MKFLFTFPLLFLYVFNDIYGCQCIPQTLAQGVEWADHIFIGKVTKHYQDTFYYYEIQPFKIWKGTVELDEKVTIKQGGTSCSKAGFETNLYYLFYIENGSVKNCSRTKEYYYSQDEKKLDEIYPNAREPKIYPQEFNDVQYEKNYVIRMADDTEIDIRNKNIAFFNGKKMYSKLELSQNGNWFYTLQIYLIGEEITCGNKKYDYLFFFEIEHQSREFNEKSKRKLTSKFRRKVCK